MIYRWNDLAITAGGFLLQLVRRMEKGGSRETEFIVKHSQGTARFRLILIEKESK